MSEDLRKAVDSGLALLWPALRVYKQKLDECAPAWLITMRLNGIEASEFTEMVMRHLSSEFGGDLPSAVEFAQRVKDSRSKTFIAMSIYDSLGREFVQPAGQPVPVGFTTDRPALGSGVRMEGAKAILADVRSGSDRRRNGMRRIGGEDGNGNA